jgi:hypothetical protein
VQTLAGSKPGGFADGKLADAKFSQPIGLAVDKAKALVLVADTLNHRLRVVDVAKGVVSTMCGGSEPGDDSGAVGAAKLNAPRAVAVDGRDGSVVVVDATRIRRIKDGE